MECVRNDPDHISNLMGNITTIISAISAAFLKFLSWSGIRKAEKVQKEETAAIIKDVDEQKAVKVELVKDVSKEAEQAVEDLNGKFGWKPL